MAGKKSSQDEQITKYAPLVKRIAYHMMARLPASVEVDDLIQVGLIGLMDAVARFDGSQGAQFESYATQRIRGAMLDELREADWLPRHVRQKSRQIETAIHKLEQRNGRAPSEQEISAELGLALDQYQSMLGDVKCSQLLYYEDFSDEDSASFLERYLVDGSNDPLAVLEDEGFRDSLIAAIHHLPERERSMMGMYYEQDMNLKEIGAVLGVSESRVCQLHSQAVARLRAQLKIWKD
ncbi:RNA polymerase sigma factor FliA [Betaproteobacteria bacterium SCN1]|jgi:RNA polymerase sigma factor for flagellar operon FliA|nr:RNA polymerase sigma factor FliA [Betaproteobacteria bacterium SCN1]MBN8761394.1 RNA polymerase sigma factor FliA [Thiobacillus sp.]ODU89229.1 MAG: RNA polymerase sigma factor FliA [Thiobacillus sp. SCN 65-179]OJW34542.1 MAG: RNA polymerase sigma factor FliA [Thiobacillus sp. 65-69]